MKNTVQNVKNTKKYCHTGEPGKKIISDGYKISVEKSLFGASNQKKRNYKLCNLPT